MIKDMWIPCIKCKGALDCIPSFVQRAALVEGPGYGIKGIDAPASLQIAARPYQRVTRIVQAIAIQAGEIVEVDRFVFLSRVKIGDECLRVPWRRFRGFSKELIKVSQCLHGIRPRRPSNQLSIKSYRRL